MADQTMAERVAKAIRAERRAMPIEEPWKAGEEHAFRREARAAIEAMMMPTKAMIEAAYAPTDDLVLARLKWEAMLNAALAAGDASGEKAGITQAPSAARV